MLVRNTLLVLAVLSAGQSAAAGLAAEFAGASTVPLDNPHDLKLSPDGRHLFVADVGHNRVAILDPETLELVAEFGSDHQSGTHDVDFDSQGRVYVADYKSNRLPAYDADALAHAMAASEYDLQALLYAIAVHRWLRLRLGAEYAFARHFGGVRYLFCRGLDAGDPSRGVATPDFPAALIEAADALLGGTR